MTWPLDDILLGPATFGRLHRLDALFLHTGEEPGFGRDYAVATARWQRTNPGSYSFRVYEGGVMLNVPWMEASGGINPSSAAWAPGRHPWIERELAKAGKCPVANCPGPYRNPTMHAGQISFVGRTAQLEAGQAPANYQPDAERLIAWYETHPLRGPAPLVIVNHGHLQTNRSDAGVRMHSALTAQEDDMPKLIYKPELWTVSDSGADLRTEPVMLKTNKVGQIPPGTPVFTVAESEDGIWRLAVAGDPEGLFWVVRKGPLIPKVPGGDPELHGAIATAVGLRLAGQPVTFGDCEAEVVQAEQETRAHVNQEWRDWLATAPAAAGDPS